MRKYLLTAIFLAPMVCFAQAIKLPPLAPGLGSDAWDFIHAILQILKWVLIPAIAIIIIYSGFKMATAQGNPTEIKTERGRLTYAIVALCVILIADYVVEIIRKTGTEILQ